MQTLVRNGGAVDRPTPPLLRHPAFAWLGLRPIFSWHTADEHAALKRWATGKSSLVEIGVAEGASAVALRESMSPGGILWLIDPFHLSRMRRVNAMKRAAHRAIRRCDNGRVIWIEKFSFEAAKEWRDQIHFLFIDGDHSELAVQRDWDDWSQYVVSGGVVVFHDARVFPGGWTQPDWGPVKVLDRLSHNGSLADWQIVEEVDSLVVVRRLPNEKQAPRHASLCSYPYRHDAS